MAKSPPLTTSQIQALEDHLTGGKRPTRRTKPNKKSLDPDMQSSRQNSKRTSGKQPRPANPTTSALSPQNLAAQQADNIAKGKQATKQLSDSMYKREIKDAMARNPNPTPRNPGVFTSDVRSGDAKKLKAGLASYQSEVKQAIKDKEALHKAYVRDQNKQAQERFLSKIVPPKVKSTGSFVDDLARKNKPRSAFHTSGSIFNPNATPIKATRYELARATLRKHKKLAVVGALGLGVTAYTLPKVLGRRKKTDQ